MRTGSYTIVLVPRPVIPLSLTGRVNPILRETFLPRIGMPPSRLLPAASLISPALQLIAGYLRFSMSVMSLTTWIVLP
jgi:hypothetical protein